LIQAWRTGDASCEIDMVALRETRLRAYFGERYDHRRNLIDYNYERNVKPVSSIIHRKQVREIG